MRYGCVLILVFFVSTISKLCGQVGNLEDIYEPIIDLVEVLESEKDAKCQATAFRFEDFLFGLPLSSEARSHRIELQKRLAYQVWRDLTIKFDDTIISNVNINEIADQYIRVEVTNGDLYLRLKNDDKIKLTKQDLRQYSSIAYNLRALLAVRQEYIGDPNQFIALKRGQLSKFKQILDITMLGILKIATQHAQELNNNNLSPTDLDYGYKQIVHKTHDTGIFPVKEHSKQGDNLIQQIIDQKLAAYKAYNNINQAVFLRNLQVYFAKVKFPKDSILSVQLATTFQDYCISFGLELLESTIRESSQHNEGLSSYDDVSTAAQKLLPFQINQFEDVTFFPNYKKDEIIVVESYDLDAFRDSGLHWKIIKFMLSEHEDKSITMDPFAIEHFAESIAQFGVLLWRLSGQETKLRNETTLTLDHLISAQKKLVLLSNKHPSESQVSNIAFTEVQSSITSDTSAITYFEDVTLTAGINHFHKSSDWLSRLLRSYVKDSINSLAKLSIPPAFGGAGIAAADINNDGYDDLLLLSGLGNQLLLNNKDKTFTDITITSGIQLMRDNGTYGEPRQPIIADFDNDGHQDILITYVDDNHQLWQGIGDGSFINKSSIANLGGKGLIGGPATSADFNNDGLLDIYIGYFGNYLSGQLPTLARHNTNGGINQLFLNQGGFKFENVTLAAGIGNNGWTQAVGHTDINSDGLQDIIVGNDFGTNAYLINDGKTFHDTSSYLGTDKPSYTMNIGIGDINRDLLPDFYISNIVVMEKDDKYVLPNEDQPMQFDAKSLSSMRVVEANDLFLSSSDHEDLQYANSDQVLSGGHLTGWSWDADFWDYDNDGDDDLYCLTGMNPYSVYGTDNPYYQDPNAAAREVTFATSNKSPNVLFTNNNGALEATEYDTGLSLNHTSRSATYTDYDRDGDLDVVVANYHGATMLFENKSSNNNKWIQIKLTDLTSGKNRDAIGARLIVTLDNGQTIWREIHATDGYLSVHPKTMAIGLGNNQISSLKIIWPDGYTSKVDITATNQHLSIKRMGEKLTVYPTFK